MDLKLFFECSYRKDKNFIEKRPFEGLTGRNIGNE